MTHEDTRRQITELGASLFDRGYSVGSAGNISVRVPGGILVTPTNSSLGRLDPARISLLDDQWELVDGDRPSKEVVMHRAVYEARPDTQAVVHLHSVYVTALSCLVEDPLTTPLTPYFVMRLGRSVATVPYFRPGDAAMDGEIRAAAASAKAVILRNHGSLVAGSSLVDAVNSAEELEASAQLEFMLHGRQTRPLTTAEVDDLLG